MNLLKKLLQFTIALHLQFQYKEQSNLNKITLLKTRNDK